MATVKQEEPIEKQLWKAADKLRKNIDVNRGVKLGSFSSASALSF